MAWQEASITSSIHALIQRQNVTIENVGDCIETRVLFVKHCIHPILNL